MFRSLKEHFLKREELKEGAQPSVAKAEPTVKGSSEAALGPRDCLPNNSKGNIKIMAGERLEVR